MAIRNCGLGIVHSFSGRVLHAITWTVFFAGCAGPQEADRRPSPSPDVPTRASSVVLITVDTLRADRLSAYGYDRPTSPRIDRLASEGALFEKAFAQRGLTWPSLSSIMTSRYPRDHGVRDNGQWLAKSKLTLAEILNQADFRTAAFLTNMTNAPNRGFEHKEVFPVDAPEADRDRPTDTLATEAAVRWLEATGESRFFLWLHLLAPHASYAPPTEFENLFLEGLTPVSGDMDDLWRITSGDRQASAEELASIQALYDAEIAFTDHLVGLVLDRLDEMGLADTTMVILTADHGEELYQRHKYFFHQCSVYDSVLQLPLIVRYPQQIEPNQRIQATIQSLDFAPTILEILGISIPPDFKGRSLVSMMTQTEAAGTPARKATAGVTFAELGPEIESVRTSKWRLVLNPNQARVQAGRGEAGRSCYMVGKAELYDLRVDPNEQVNVISQHPEVAAELTEMLRAWHQTTPETEPGDGSVHEETLRELRALGYVQ